MTVSRQSLTAHFLRIVPLKAIAAATVLKIVPNFWRRILPNGMQPLWSYNYSIVETHTLQSSNTAKFGFQILL